jgi:hypothetical protein
MRSAEAMDMITLSNLCDITAGNKRPIPSGQANGFQLTRQCLQPGFGPPLKHFLAFLCYFSCHFNEINRS